MRLNFIDIGVNQTDKDTRTGVLLVLGLMLGSMIVGIAMHHFWQRYSVEERSRNLESRYVSLGQHVMTVNGSAVIMKLSVEYVGHEAESALTQAMPRLKGEVVRRMSRIDMADLPRLKTPEGKQELANEVLHMIRAAMDSARVARNVKEILFEKFVIES